MAAQKYSALKKAHLAENLWSWNFKFEFFPLQSDKTIIFPCLIVGMQVPLTQQWFASTVEAATGGVL